MDYKKIGLFLGGLAGLVAVFTYLETGRKRKLDETVAGLDAQIKKLQLEKLQSNNIPV